jgi:RNA polymerase sigma-70 factor (ECF subfamily)
VDDEPDETLVERCREGDRSAFAVLVGRYHRPIYNAAYRVLGNAEDASDITQVVFMRVTERLDDFDSRYKFFSWIYRIAVNESLNMLRRGKREEQLDDDADFAGSPHDDPESRLGAVQVSAQLRAALLRLPTAARMVISLRHFSDCSYEEIGQILDIDEKTVKSRLYEARQRLRELLKDLRP